MTTVIDTTVVVSIMNMNSFTQLTLLVTVNQLEDPSVKSIFPLEKRYPPSTIFHRQCCTLPETNVAPENGWLEDDRFLLG